jgi:hypothetical protein
LEGDIDPDDKIKLSTRIVDHVNKETYYLTPVLEKIDGKFSYSHKISQADNFDKYLLTAQAKAQVEENNNLSLHVQNFDSKDEEANRDLYRKYAQHLKKYIDYIYSQNIDLDPSKLQDLENAYIYYGSIANGQSPAVEAGFQVENRKHDDEVSKKFSTLGGTNGIQETSISYGVSNLPGSGEAHSIENVVASATGNETVSGLKMASVENLNGNENATIGQAVAKLAPSGSVTIVDANGKVNGEGFTKNASYSEDENGVLATVGEVMNKSENEYLEFPQKKGFLSRIGGNNGLGNKDDLPKENGVVLDNISEPSSKLGSAGT